MDPADITEQVKNHYSAVERTANGRYEHSVASAFGYTEEELASVPEGANLGLSCGNPLVLAKLREGEVIIDLGSGAGFDVFGAANKVGPSGKAIGVDMSEAMISKAMANKEKTNTQNVEFVHSPITAITLPDATADCIISNCVVNLVPGPLKQSVFNEIFRLLKPGGRVAVSDILARRELPAQMVRDIALYVGCISGASQVSEYETYLKTAGFRDVLIVDAKHDLNVYVTAARAEDTSAGCCGSTASGTQAGGSAVKPDLACCTPTPSTTGTLRELPESMKNIDLNEWAGSFQIYAEKP